MCERMYGLFFRHYDWFEWDVFVAASMSKEKLKKHFDEVGEGISLIEENEHEEYEAREEPHYCIVEIKHV